MDDRYEIKGKIGQGGLGSVYKAYDVRMNREVAIKRIISNSDDVNLPQEATRQLIKEASSLASLQHPNIVTIYDVGEDADGPFVVMELLSGDTLEEAISKGSFTWLDFRELATQILEALIAAQELHIVHRDLKPSNIMLTWLPSGKFQVKIVDFGLAKLSDAPSLQTIDQSNGVFGSIYFMAPEQFERVPIDQRCDMYAIGCVFYYALTGMYPFDGDSAAAVMASHLQHFTAPLQDIRSGIPVWSCDWIMWHINRQPGDRPESARQSLRYFLDNEAAYPDPPLSEAVVADEADPEAQILGGTDAPEIRREHTATQRVKTASQPKPLLPPEGSKPSIHNKTDAVDTENTEAVNMTAADLQAADEAKRAQAAGNKGKTGPIKIATSSTPLKSTSKVATITSKTKPAIITGKVKTGGANETSSQTIGQRTPVTMPQSDQGFSMGKKIVAACVLGLVVILLGYFIKAKMAENARNEKYNEMVSIAKDPDATEVPMDEERLEIMLESAASVGANSDRGTIYQALVLGKAIDGTKIDERIAEFATSRVLPPDIQLVLIRDVLRKRNNPEVIDILLEFARNTSDEKATVAALEATRNMATDKHFSDFLNFIQTTGNDQIRKAAEENAAAIIEKSSSTKGLARTLMKAHKSALNEEVRHAMLRLLGRIGGSDALKLVSDSLQSSNEKDQIAAIIALSTWGDNEGYDKLIDFLASSPERTLRDLAYRSAFSFASEAENDLATIWYKLSRQTVTEEEQKMLIRGVANTPPQSWSYTLLNRIIADSKSSAVKDLAKRAMARLKEIEKSN